MKRLKDNLIIMFILLGIVSIIYGIEFVKYKFWRAEYPQAKTWTFFVPSSKN